MSLLSVQQASWNNLHTETVAVKSHWSSVAKQGNKINFEHVTRDNWENCVCKFVCKVKGVEKREQRKAGLNDQSQRVSNFWMGTCRQWDFFPLDKGDVCIRTCVLIYWCSILWRRRKDVLRWRLQPWCVALIRGTPPTYVSHVTCDCRIAFPGTLDQMRFAPSISDSSMGDTDFGTATKQTSKAFTLDLHPMEWARFFTAGKLAIAFESWQNLFWESEASPDLPTCLANDSFHECLFSKFIFGWSGINLAQKVTWSFSLQVAWIQNFRRITISKAAAHSRRNMPRQQCCLTYGCRYKVALAAKTCKRACYSSSSTFCICNAFCCLLMILRSEADKPSA